MAQNKRKITVLPILLFALIITACTQQGSNQANNSSEAASSQSQKYEIKKVDFEIASTVTLNDKAKAYVDKMHEQEKLSAHPYRFNALDGIDNIHVENELSNQDDKLPKPVKISWDRTGLNYETVDLVLSTEPEFYDSTCTRYTTAEDFVELDFLHVAKKYYYRLEDTAGNFESQVGEFETEAYTRTINLNGGPDIPENVRNVRDLGGYMTVFGHRVAQGLVYRGGELNIEEYKEGTTTHKKNVDDVVLAKQRDYLNIGTEIDLRTDSEANKATSSALGEDVNYVRKTLNSYASFIKDPDNGKPGTLKAIFDELVNCYKKHVYFHCKGGADRTGALAFIINGMLGVSLTDLYIDFELTTQSGSTFRSHLTKSQSYDFPAMMKEIKALDYYTEDAPLCEVCYEFLLRHGVEQEDLEYFRGVMVPGYGPGSQYVGEIF